MLPDLNDIRAPNVDDGAANTLCRLDNNVVVFCHLERVEGLGLLAGHVQYTLIDGIGNAVVDELGQNQTILALVEHLEGVGRERQAAADVAVARKNSVDVAREFGTFIFVDGVGDVSVRALNEDLAAATDGGLRCVARSSASRPLSDDRSGS